MYVSIYKLLAKRRTNMGRSHRFDRTIHDQTLISFDCPN